MSTTGQSGLASSAFLPTQYGLDRTGKIIPYNPNYGFNNTSTVDVGAVNRENIDKNLINLPSKTNETTGWSSAIKDWFTPGQGGSSVGGNMLKGAGEVVGGLSGLAGMYYTKKNFDLQKDQADYLKGRDAASDKRMSKFASNAGNGASY